MNGYEALKVMVDGGTIEDKEGRVFWLDKKVGIINDGDIISLNSFLKHDGYKKCDLVCFVIKKEINLVVIYESDVVATFDEASNYAKKISGRLPKQAELLYIAQNFKLKYSDWLWTCHQDTAYAIKQYALVATMLNNDLTGVFEYRNQNEKNYFIVIKDLTEEL